MGQRMVNVFIAEDSAIMLDSLQSALAGLPGIEVIGHAADEAEAMRRIEALSPDIVVLDIGFRSGAGMSMLKNIKRRHAGIEVMVLSGCTDELYLEHCRKAGADGFFDRAFQLTRLREALSQRASPTPHASEEERGCQLAGIHYCMAPG